jgi:hypothetical protein
LLAFAGLTSVCRPGSNHHELMEATTIARHNRHFYTLDEVDEAVKTLSCAAAAQTHGVSQPSGIRRRVS